jgi:hypothetical protein
MDPVSRAQSASNQDNRLARFGNKLNTWKKGQSGNPSGIAKKQNFTKICAKLLRKKENKQLIETVMRDILDKRGMAAVLLLREMAERTEGKVTQSVEMSGELTLTLAEAIAQARQRRDGPKLLIEDVDAA